MNIVAMIPARSGSKGLPDKNIKELCGRPLIDYPIKAAKGCKKIDRVVLNSDSTEYLRLGEKLGAEPFYRHERLAQDDVSMKEVLVDFISTMKLCEELPDAIIVLYPTYPLRTSKDLTEIIGVFGDLGEGSLIGVKEPDTHPYLCYKNCDKWTSVINPNPDKYYRRQSYPSYYEISHFACIFSTKVISKLNAQLINSTTYGYKIDSPVVDIDTPEDFEYAEYLMKKK